MLLERVEGKDVITRVVDPTSLLPKLLFAAKHVFIAEGPADDSSNYHPLPVFTAYFRKGGWPIGYLCWVESGQFCGASIYGQHDLPFNAITFEALAYAALGTKEYSLSMS
jgi:hypothetical protein